MAASYQRLGLIAGGGELPVHVAAAAAAEGRLGCVVALEGFADPARYDNAVPCGLARVGAMFKALHAARCDAVCFAGVVARPDFSAIKPDMKGMSLLPKVLAAAARGEDLARHLGGTSIARAVAAKGQPPARA